MNVLCEPSDQRFSHCCRNGSLKQIADNIQYARLQSPDDLGLQMAVLSPGQSLDTVIDFLTRMKHSYSPLTKMENLLAAQAAIDDLVSSCCLTVDLHLVTLEYDFYNAVFA